MDNIWSENFLFLIIKPDFQVKLEFYLFYYNAFFKDCILFKWTRSSIEIDTIVVKKHIFVFKSHCKV